MSGLDVDFKKFPDHVIPAKKVVGLVKEFKLKDERELMVRLASHAGDLPQTPVSGFQVGIVGKEKETGDLLIGGNLEFLGAPLGLTVHAEQFLFARAFHRGHSIENFALGKPTPCGHCRQFIMEFAGAKNIRVQNAAGLDFRIGDLLPFSFGPEQLNQKGIGAAVIRHGLKWKTAKKSHPEIEKSALKAANASYCPYSNAPSGVAVKTKSEIVVGSYIENAAFNPSLSPLHSALINLTAAGFSWQDIQEVVLVQTKAKIDQAPMTRSLLEIIAPKAKLHVLEATSKRNG